MESPTLEDFFRDCFSRFIINFDLRVQMNERGEIGFYVHPEGREGATLDFIVVGNAVRIGSLFAA